MSDWVSLASPVAESRQTNQTPKVKGLILFLILVSTTGCSFLPGTVEPVSNDQSLDNSVQIFVTNHGWHTGIVLSTSALEGVLPQRSNRLTQQEYIEVGWGDAGFYQAKDAGIGLTLRALLWPSDTVLHLVGFSGQPKHYFPSSQVYSVPVQAANMWSLREFIRNSFAIDSSGRIMKEQQGLYGISEFYRGIGQYSLLNTCNTWTAKALYSAGLPIDPRFQWTASAITDFLDQYL